MDLSSVRIREHFGLVSNDSHIEQFHFLVSPPKDRPSVQKNDYVLVDHPILGETTQILAVIEDISSYEEIAGSTINERKGKMLATAKVVGCVDLTQVDKPLQKVLAPPTPGSRVYIPLKNFLQDILNRNRLGQTYKTPLSIGTYNGLSIQESKGIREIECCIDLHDFLLRHTLLSAMAGSGKTYFARRIAKALQEKAITHMVIFDAYGEYTQVTSSSIALPVIKENLRQVLIAHKTVRLDGSKLSLDQRRNQFNQTLEMLLNFRLEGKVPTILLIIEEAENLKGAVLEEAVAIGRKCGLMLFLLTAHPLKLSGEVLAELGNEIVGRTIDKGNLECLSNIAAEYPLATLTIGEWVVNGIAAARPLKVKVE